MSENNSPDLSQIGLYFLRVVQSKILPMLRTFCMSVIFSSMPLFSFANGPKVIVVGAGIAGLTTAYRLHKAGMDVELYEARARVGGRIFTAKINGHIAELGGQNINDGGEAFNLHRLIDELGLQCDSSRINLKHSYFNGKELISMSEVLKGKNIDPNTLKNQLRKLALTCCNIAEILGEIVDPHSSLYKILAVRMAAYEGEAVEKLSPLYIGTLFHMFLGVIDSAKENKEEQPYINRVTITGGNAMLPLKIGEALDSRLHLNMPLVKVAKTRDNLFHLTFKNGKQVEANILVLAMPCSVYEKIIFEDDLIASEKLEAICKIQYGTNAKVILPFTPLAAKTTGLVVADENISSFDCAKQLLTVYYTGKTSLFCPATVANPYRQVEFMIETSFTKDCLPITPPIYAEDQINLSYDCPVGYSWPNDPYAKGSYAYITMGQEDLLTATVKENGETFKALFAPIQQQLYFVGEHTSILSDVPGTMEAACESGERIARAILQTHLSSLPLFTEISSKKARD